MNPDELRTLQLCELKILRELNSICKKNNIQYFLHSGTLLGALRHQGFIPWDDDIDIGMSRKDYMDFLENCTLEIGKEYFIQTTSSDSGYALPFLKIRLDGTSYKEKTYDGILEHDGIWIDVFPFDYVPNNKYVRFIHQVVFTVLEDATLYKYKYTISTPKTLKGRAIQPLCKLLSHLPKSTLLHLREKVMTMFNRHPTNYCVNWPFKPKSSKLLEGTTMMEFETFQFPVPIHWKEYLEEVYGDYMQLPPEDQRQSHSPYAPDFGKYAYIKTIDDILENK